MRWNCIDSPNFYNISLVDMNLSLQHFHKQRFQGDEVKFLFWVV